MDGISYKAIYGPENRYKYNRGNELQNKEFSDGSGLELYDAKHRMYDPQTGRFNRIDPLADIFNSLTPYCYSYNNPAKFTDPYGLAPQDDENFAPGFGPSNITGYVRRLDGTIYFDPNVHDQNDLPPNSGLEYMGERLIGTKNDGSVVWFDENGKSTTTNPGWENLTGITVTAKAPPKFNNYLVNPFTQTSAYRHWSGLTTINRYTGRFDDGDALRFFSDLKDQRKAQIGGDVVGFIPLNYWLSVALGGLALLSDKQIDAIIDKYNETGDKQGIKVTIENIIDAGSGNMLNYSIKLNKDETTVGQVSQVIFGPAL